MKTQRRTKPTSEPGLGTKVQHLAESAVDTAKTAIYTGKEIATATAKKIKNVVS